MKKLLTNQLFLMIVALSSLFATCEEKGEVVGGGATEIIAIVENGSQFNDVKKVKVMVWDESARKNVVFTEANFTNGSFTIILPEAVDSKYLEKIEDDMPKEIAISNKNARTLCISSIYGFDSSDKRIVSFCYEKEEGNTYAAMNWLYTDSDLTVSGTITHTEWVSGREYEYTETYSLALKKGWNIVYEITTETRQSNKYTEKYENTSSAVSGLKWVGEKE